VVSSRATLVVTKILGFVASVIGLTNHYQGNDDNEEDDKDDEGVGKGFECYLPECAWFGLRFLAGFGDEGQCNLIDRCCFDLRCCCRGADGGCQCGDRLRCGGGRGGAGNQNDVRGGAGRYLRTWCCCWRRGFCHDAAKLQ